MGRKGISQSNHSANIKQLGRYTHVSSAQNQSHPDDDDSHHEDADTENQVMPRTNSDVYYVDDDADEQHESDDNNSNDSIVDDEDSLEDAYEVYSVHAAHKSSIRTGAWIALVILVVVPSALLGFFYFSRGSSALDEESDTDGATVFPSKELLGDGLGRSSANDTNNGSYAINHDDYDRFPPYDVRADFRNDLGNVPPYWGQLEHEVDNGVYESNPSFTSFSSWGPCYTSTQKTGDYATNSIETTEINWTEQILMEKPNRHSNDNINYPLLQKSTQKPTPKAQYYAGKDDLLENPHLQGLCRPGFLIIGQGKCGTSSLYHYLTGHPRILPASEKQIDYFKYRTSLPMQWYLSHFPPVETFLGRGALMTGESSPSYLPYPAVPNLIHERMRVTNDEDDNDDEEKERVGKGNFPKILVLVRDPISRAKSSYEYNYVQPALQLIQNRTSNVHGLSNAVLNRIPEGESESYYRENHLFSFEELVRAELRVLRDCLQPGGLAERKSRETYGPPNGVFADAFEKRDLKGNASLPLINADEFCYGNEHPSAQWTDLVHQYPDKIIDVANTHLSRSIVGRGIYALFVDWWYERFASKDIYIVCTEDLHDRTNDTMSNVTSFLGLPKFDFANVIALGEYNVGFHTGYDTVTTWDVIQEKSNENDGDDNVSNVGYEVDVSDELRNELMEFYQPFNERLFQIAGIHCPWGAGNDP